MTQIYLKKTLHELSDDDWALIKDKGGVFHQKEFIEFQCFMGHQVWFVLEYEGKELVAYFPLIIKKVLNFIYAQVFIEPIFINQNIKKQEKFYESLKFHVNKELMWMDANNVMSRFKSPPFQEGPKAPFGTVCVDLNKSVDDLWGQVHSKHRNVIRSAEKNHVSVEISTNPIELYSVLAQTHQKAGLGFFSQDEFKGFIKYLVDTKLCLAYRAVHEGQLQGAVLIPYNKTRAYYYYGGSIDRPVQGAMNLLHWSIMKDLKNSGVQAYDFGGVRVHPIPDSKPYTLRRFKERFGGDFEPCWMWVSIFNPLSFNIFNLLKRGHALVKGKKYKPSMVFQELARGISTHSK